MVKTNIMTTEEIHKLPYKAQLYINDLQRKIKDLNAFKSAVDDALKIKK